LAKRIPAGLLALTFGVCFLMGCQKRPEALKKPSFEGLEITVADAREPHLPGARPYQDEVTRVVREFEEKHKVKVNLLFLAREEIQRTLIGMERENAPHLCFSGEWPLAGDTFADVSSGISGEDYHDCALSYWSKDGRVLGIPSYIHWFCLAARGIEEAEHSGENVPQSIRWKTGYWPDTMAFYSSVLDSVGWDAGHMADYLEWVKDTYGPLIEDPLEAWTKGSVDGLFPVNAYLFIWLRVSQKDQKISILPVPGPFGETGFYYTVPGYVVLTQQEPMRSLAIELGKVLACHRGRWAARAMGGIPACVADMAIFNLESGFSYAERQLLFGISKVSRYTIPSAKEQAERQDILAGLEDLARDYLSGRIERQHLENGILRLLGNHNKP